MGGGMRAGGALSSKVSDPRGLVPFIQEAAAKYGIDPAVAVRVAQSEGLANPIGDGGKSGGAFQLYTGGGVGNEFQRDTGKSPLDLANEKETIDYALRRASQVGWGPWNGAKRIGIGEWEGITRGTPDTVTPSAPAGAVAPQAQQAQFAQQSAPQGQQADPMQALDQQATVGLQGAAKGIDPSVMGRLSTQEMMRRIDRAMPNADPLTKFHALEKAQKMLAPDQQVQFQMWKMQHQDEMRAALAKFQQDQTNLRMEEKFKQQELTNEQRLKDAPGTIMQTDKGPVRIRPGSNKAEPIDLGGAQPIAGTAKSSRNVEVVGADGNKIFSGAAHQNAAGQWVSDKDQKVLEIPEDANISIAGTAGGGRQGEQQAARITSAANLLSFELGNMMGLPAMSTASIFQGVESTPGRHLGESLKRTFAAKLTPETATDLATSYQGISRAVAALESGGAATGLVGLTKASEVYMPQPTDTVGNVWRKFATLRGVLERSLQAAASAKDVTPERKKLYEQIKAEVATNIPWTVEEVTKLTSGNVQTYKQLFEKTQHRIEQKAEGKAAGAAAPAAPAGPPPEAIQMLRQDASPTRRQQFDSVFGPGAADRVLGSPAVPPAAGPEFTAPIPPPQ